MSEQNDNGIFTREGHIQWDLDGTHILLYDLFVYPSCRGHECARALLQGAIAFLHVRYPDTPIHICPHSSEKGIDNARLETFYKSLGLSIEEWN